MNRMDKIIRNFGYKVILFILCIHVNSRGVAWCMANSLEFEGIKAVRSLPLMLCILPTPV
jgi:hypothetical protein